MIFSKKNKKKHNGGANKIPKGWSKSKKDRQHNGQKKKDKRTNHDPQNIHIKLKIE
jgi:hypothetical protein